MSKLSKTDFYRGKSVASTDWYLCSCSLPKLAWARRRTFNDGSADACFGEQSKLFGFDHADYASHIFSEDEYVCLNEMDGEDEYGIRLSEIEPPSWSEGAHQEFEYLGTC
jgi:hypothetical protein